MHFQDMFHVPRIILDRNLLANEGHLHLYNPNGETWLGVETVTRFAFHLGFEAEIKMSTEFKIATSN